MNAEFCIPVRAGGSSLPESLIAAASGNRCGAIIVLLINLTVGYALKYAASPPIVFLIGRINWLDYSTEYIGVQRST